MPPDPMQKFMTGLLGGPRGDDSFDHQHANQLETSNRQRRVCVLTIKCTAYMQRHDDMCFSEHHHQLKLDCVEPTLLRHDENKEWTCVVYSHVFFLTLHATTIPT